MLDILKTQIDRQSLKYSVGRAITCPTCGDIMDCTRAVEVTYSKGRAVKTGVCCTTCYDARIAPEVESIREHLTSCGIATEILDGRILWPPEEGADRSIRVDAFGDDRPDAPPMEQIESWVMGDCDCEATDGCIVEPDGHCEHGCPSWLLELGYM